MTPKLDLVFDNASDDPLITRGAVARVFRAAAPHLKLPRGAMVELGVQVVGPARIRALNRRWRKKDTSTDVLAFPLSGPRLKGYTGVSLGDLFICPRVVRAKAKAWGEPVRHQAMWTIVHGLLHLAGHDHPDGSVGTPTLRRRGEQMTRIERTILNHLS